MTNIISSAKRRNSKPKLHAHDAVARDSVRPGWLINWKTWLGQAEIKD